MKAALSYAVPIAATAAVIGLAACGTAYEETSYRTPTAPSGYARNRERYTWFSSNEVLVTQHEPVSSIALDVDTASYAVVRRYLDDQALPPRAAVRIEELINYFPYDYPDPGDLEERFSLTAGVFPTPWNPDTELMHVALKGYNPPFDARPPANIVFLIDSSGSLDQPDELALIKDALGGALEVFRPQDRIAVLSFSDSVEILIEHTSAAQSGQILQAIERLSAEGGSNGARALAAAYAQAERAFHGGAINRVILISDGGFSTDDRDVPQLRDLPGFVRRKRESGISLSVIGMGRGDLNDRRLQTLARDGGGSLSYVASAAEARKALTAEFGANLFPLADDVRMLVEFNPARVAEYRLLGYESNRRSASDFADPNARAGTIGSGHSLTVLYEIIAPDSPARRLLPLRYALAGDSVPADVAEEYALVRVRYKKPGEVRDLQHALTVTAAQRFDRLSSVPDDLRFATAVAAFGEKLRDERRIGRSFGYGDIGALARDAVGRDPQGYRRGFLELVARAQDIECRLARVPMPGCNSVIKRTE